MKKNIYNKCKQYDACNPNYPFENGFYDVIICCGASGYFNKNINVAFDEWLKLLKPNGIIVLTLLCQHQQASIQEKVCVQFEKEKKWILLERTNAERYMPNNENYNKHNYTYVYYVAKKPNLKMSKL